MANGNDKGNGRNKTIFSILGAIGIMVLSITGTMLVNWVNNVNAAASDVAVLKALAPRVESMMVDIKDDVKAMRVKIDALERRKE